MSTEVELTEGSKAFLGCLANSKVPPSYELPAPEARVNSSKFTTWLVEGEKVADDVTIKDANIQTKELPVPVRIFVPANSDTRTLLVYMHGGGWTLGSPFEDHNTVVLSRMAKAGCFSVVSIDYRLAPEHKFPAGVDDCVGCTEWLLSTENRESIGLPKDIVTIGVGGDSAGGNLSAVVTHELKRKGLNALKFQVLLYPAVNLNPCYPSHEKFAEGYFLDKHIIKWSVSNYVQSDADKMDPRGSPILHEDFSGLPRCLIICGDCDPLVDGSIAYGKKLEEAGVPVECLIKKGIVHGYFFYLKFFKQVSEMSQNTIVDFIRNCSH